MNRSTVQVLAVLTAMLCTSVAVAAQRSYNRQLPAPPGGHFTLRTAVGSVSVIGHAAQDVAVHVAMRGPQSFLDRLHISARTTPSGVRISARLYPGDRLEAFDFWSRQRVRFSVEVPSDDPVALHTSGGNLTVQRLTAPVRAYSSGGRIRLQRITGAISAHTSGGSVAAKHINGAADLSTSGGSIAVSDGSGPLMLRTSGGNIRLQNDDGAIDAVTSGGDIRADLRGNCRIALRTSGGNVSLLLPHDARGAVDASTDGGTVSIGFPLTTTATDSPTHLRGTIGGGGATIDLHSSGGDIQIRPAS